MSGHVFISYANSDLEVAERVCEGLEHRGTKCWIAPRDVTPGKSYGSEIVRAIQSASSMVLIFTSRANASPHVVTEVERAFSHRLRMFPLRLEQVELSEELQYYLSRPHWVDAFGKNLGPSLERLFDHVAAARAEWAGSPISTVAPPNSDAMTQAKAEASTLEASLDLGHSVLGKTTADAVKEEHEFGRANQLYHIGDWRLYREDTYLCFWHGAGELAIEVEGHLQSWNLRENGKEYSIIHGEKNREAEFRDRFWNRTAREPPVVVGPDARFEINGWLLPDEQLLTVSVVPAEIRITDVRWAGSQIELPRHEARIYHTNYLGSRFEYPQRR